LLSQEERTLLNEDEDGAHDTNEELDTHAIEDETNVRCQFGESGTRDLPEKTDTEEGESGHLHHTEVEGCPVSHLFFERAAENELELLERRCFLGANLL
jgi:hypothetical protein